MMTIQNNSKDGENMSHIYPVTKNDVTTYRVYFVANSKKIYLGAYKNEVTAQRVLEEAKTIMKASFGLHLMHDFLLDYKKQVCLSNYRDYSVYIKNPIYLHDTYFTYYLSKDTFLIFDNKDLFYFSTSHIRKRGNYLYIQDSISQQNLLSRFGIPNHSVVGKDYIFRNGNTLDFRRENLQILNAYKGVSQKLYKGNTLYMTHIFTTKNILVGKYESEIEAAIAYNKAIDLLSKEHANYHFVPNTIAFLTQSEYDALYTKLKISPRLLSTAPIRQRLYQEKTYRGTCKNKNGYRASISYEGKQLYLGIYPTEKRAAQAYNYATFYLYGNKGPINDITPLIHEFDTPKIARHLSKHHIKKGE